MIKRAIIIFLFCPSAAFAYTGFDYYTYFGTTSETHTVIWSPGQGAEKYEFRLYHHEQKVYVDLGTTAALEYKFQLPRSGHYTAQVRSLRQESLESILSSPWAESTNSAVAIVNGNPRAWWLYGHIAPPGPLEMPF